MALRDKPPFRADHVGSLLRPPELLQAREKHAAGRIDDDALRAVEDEAIRDVVALQRDVGLRSATDGEFRRASWHMDFIYSLDGVTKAPGDLKVQFHNEQGDIEFTPAAMRVDGRLGVSDAIFGDAFAFLQVDGFFMEWDDARSGGFEPLRFAPPGKTVVLGLVTTKRGELEDRDALLRRIDEAAQFVDVDQLCLSPQCGFSSTVEGNALTREQQADKLRLIVDVANEVWG